MCPLHHHAVAEHPRLHAPENRCPYPGNIEWDPGSVDPYLRVRHHHNPSTRGTWYVPGGRCRVYKVQVPATFHNPAPVERVQPVGLFSPPSRISSRSPY